MNRLLLALILALTSALGSHALYTAVRPLDPPEVCSMRWLAEQLKLTSAQYEAIWAIHERRCAELCELAQKAGSSPIELTTRAEQACRFATRQLIDEVCAQLTPGQRDKYLQIVAPCLTQSLTQP